MNLYFSHVKWPLINKSKIMLTLPISGTGRKPKGTQLTGWTGAGSPRHIIGPQEFMLAGVLGIEY